MFLAPRESMQKNHDKDRRKGMLHIFSSHIKKSTRRVSGENDVVKDEKQSEVELVRDSGLFDATYYLQLNKDVRKSGVDPLRHFMEYGGKEARSPSRNFDAKYYLAQNPDVRESGVNPLVHYLTYGRLEGRQPLPAPISHEKKRGNSSKHKRIDILSVNFYDWDGKCVYRGGAERYIYDLASMLQSNGHTVRILQNANKPFEKIFRGIRVSGVMTGSSKVRGISEAFREQCTEADLVITSPLDLACAIDNVPVIGINHGIYWDHIERELATHRTVDYQEIMDSLVNIELGICVDTNFINWVRTYDFNLAQKLTYIPNYYDCKEFRTTKKDFTKDLTVLFPRRLYEARGIYLTLDAFDKILKKHPDVRLLLVGQGDDKRVAKAIQRLAIKYEARVSLEEYPMEEMPAVYSRSHIVLIPTLHSEGTSLSCIEAMATNNALIVTTIGGLPNLVISEYNGIVIDPNVESLVGALEGLILDRTKLASMAQRALGVAEVFEKEKWDQRWAKVFKEIV